MPLLLDVWREAGRNIEIGEFASRVAPVVVRQVPVDMVMIRRLDLRKECVETVATGLCRSGRVPEWSRTECSCEQLEALAAWSRQDRVLRAGAGELSKALPGLLPVTHDFIEPGAGVLAGALNRETEPMGMLVLLARDGQRLRPEHEVMVDALREPFAVALENDRQLRELTQLREAAEAENRSLKSRLGRQDISESVVGAENGLRDVMERVGLVAHSDVPVLILGETGSGKEVVARAIHNGSRRTSGPFLRVNCGAIPPELVDSELFGHERGSFTGAVATRKGWFERADGGTLFLDEVGELPLAAQVRLLRILQDGTFERVGGQHTLHVDVRVVAATNRDLRQMVADRQFREDLWYRVAVFIIRIPPLRERIEDIPPLAAHFALRTAKRLGTIPLVPTPKDNDLLVSYNWPGNVRELSAVIERAAILGNGKFLDVATALGGGHLVPSPTASTASPIPASDGFTIASGFSGLGSACPSGAPSATTADHGVSLNSAMARHIEDALRKTLGRIEGPFGAAKLLGINPHTLRARMRKLGVNWKKYRTSAEAGNRPGTSGS